MTRKIVEDSSIHGYHVDKVTPIPELNCQLVELTHEKSGASVMHIANNDEENVFCILFQTIPTSSNGVAHILEHSVLCGSKKYPIKDPFFSMNRRSLNTFMNAMTGADFTCYPAASQVPKDFYNLFEVYLDAVFHPLLRKNSFLQEGWRYEFSEENNPNSSLEYGGIVFNEMKGALTDPSTRLVENLNQALYPDLTYGLNSGGDPKNIPELTYEEFLDFHHSCYHPSRSIFYFYGNIPLENHLSFLNEKLLNNVEKVEPHPPLPRQQRFNVPIEKVAHYPIAQDESEEGKSILSLGWLTCHILEQKELLALTVLDHILMSNDASPLKYEILQSNLCKQASSYIEGDVTEVPFVLILQGCNADSAKKLEEIILNKLKSIVQEGIPSYLLDDTLHQLELERSEISGGKYPYGLDLFFRSALFKQHQGNSEYGLMIHSLFEELKNAIKKNPRYLEDLLDKHLIQNKHRVLITLKPSKELTAKELEAEKKTLESIQVNLTEEQKKEILKQTLELDQYQKSHKDEDLEVLPKISLEDIPKKSKDYPLHQHLLKQLEVFHHDCFTNGIFYADLIYKLPEISEEDLFMVRLFEMLIPQLGAGGRNYKEQLRYLEANTGGLFTSLGLNTKANDFNLFHPTLHIKSKALHDKVPNMFGIIQDIVKGVDLFDINRIKEVLYKHFTGLEASFNQNAMKYAINLASSGLNIPSRIANDWFGLNFFYSLRDLVTNFDKRKDSLIERLKCVQENLLGLEHPNLVISCDQASFDEAMKHSFYGMDSLPQHISKPWKSDYSFSPISSQGRIIPSQVAFSSRVIETVPYIHHDTATLNIAGELFNNLTLHPRIREQGGAYGSGASNNSFNGFFYFYAFRDPNITTSIEAFNEAVQRVSKGDFDESDLEEAKREVIQGVDSPTPPGSRGGQAYSWLQSGLSLDVRQKHRNSVLGATKDEVMESVKKHLLEHWETSKDVVFAGQELLERENGVLVQKGFPKLEIVKV